MSDDFKSRKFQSGRNKVYSSKTAGHWCFCNFCFPAKGFFNPSFKAKSIKVDNKLTLEQSFDEVVDELRKIIISKNLDYGPNNILNTPGGSLNGLNVRLYDKIERLNHLLSKKTSPNNESLRDTFIDIANYAIIGMLVIDSKWGK
jgi:hypothetical protein